MSSTSLTAASGTTLTAIPAQALLPQIPSTATSAEIASATVTTITATAGQALDALAQTLILAKKRVLNQTILNYVCLIIEFCVGISGTINPIFLVISLLALVVLGINLCCQYKGKRTLEAAQTAFNRAVDTLMASNDYEVTAQKIAILSKHKKLYSHLDLASMRPGITWQKGITYLHDQFGDQIPICAQLNTISPIPKRIALAEMGWFARAKRGNPYKTPALFNLPIGRFNQTGRLLTYEEAEVFVRAIEPALVTLGAFVTPSLLEYAKANKSLNRYTPSDDRYYPTFLAINRRLQELEGPTC